jgi:signal transduction histidine kinase
MIVWRIICVLIVLAASLNAAPKDIVLSNTEAFYKIKDARLNKNALWISITLTNNSSSSDWYIQVPPPVSEVDLYIAQKDGKFQHMQLNNKTPYVNRPVKVNGFILPLKLQKGESRHYYLRIKNNYKLKIPIYAGTLEAIYEEEHFKNVVNGFMFGALLALMIYNLYIYIAIRDKSYLFYLGYLFFSVIFLLIWNGYIQGQLLINLLLALTFWLLTIYVNLKKGYKSLLFHIAAFACVPLSYLLYEGFHSSMSIQMGLCLQSLVLSFALAVKLNDSKKQTMRLQTEMLEQTAGFSKELLIAQENEKESIATELNNRIGQQLVQLKNEIYVLEKQSQGANSDLFYSITQDIGKAIEEVSNVSFSLRPYQMDTLGLKRSLERLVEEMSTDETTNIHLNIDDLDHLLDKEAQMNLYRIVQELLSNLIKHAEATNCNIHIKSAAKHLKLNYEDNGKGYQTKNSSSGLGLSGIRERCKLLHAEIKINSKLSEGTKVSIKIPTKP